MRARFITELQKRKVVRAIGAYAVVAWVALQAAEIVFEALHVPDWGLTALVGLIALGFPVTALVAWSYELTAGGIRRDDDEAVAARPVSATGRMLDFVIIGVLLAALGYFALGDLRRAQYGAAAPGRSIAVLPFDNLSEDPANAYFAEGLSAELLNVLARVPELRVAGRTSSFSFRDKTTDIRGIAEKLGVDTVLEGSVRKSGDVVRVTAQLINASDGLDLWSDRYEHKLVDTFTIQDAIVQAVVGAMKVELLGAESAALARHDTDNVEAHTAYLRGDYEIHRRLRESVLRSEQFFRQAVEFDPGYARAWAGLAESYILQYMNHAILSREDAVGRAQAAIARALDSNATSGEIHAVLGLIHHAANDDDAASEAFQQALTLKPGFAEAWHWYALVHLRRGDYDKALEMLTHAMLLDPLHPVARMNYGRALTLQGRLEEAEAHFRRGIELDPDFPSNYLFLANLAASRPNPRPDEALQWLHEIAEFTPNDPGHLNFVINVNLELGNEAGARAALAELEAWHAGSPLALFGRIGLLIAINDYDATVAFAGQALTLHGAGLGEFAPLLRAVRGLLLEDFAAARADLLEAWPRLGVPVAPEVNEENREFAMYLAAACVGLGQTGCAEPLLDAVERHIARLPRFGPSGFGLADVDILALRGETGSAVARLRQAIDEGYGKRLINDTWPLDRYPVFENLRPDPEFQSIVRELDEYVAAIRREMDEGS